MISRWKVALISSLLLPAASLAAGGSVLRGVRFEGTSVVSASELGRGSLVRAGSPYSDSLVSLEVARIDSIYFSRGYLSASVAADTVAGADGTALRFVVEEGGRASVGTIVVSGSVLESDAATKALVRPREGEPFDPFELERSLEALLQQHVEAGYPFAQVWLTGFDYRPGRVAVDLAISISAGERSTIRRVVFEGIAKTDTSVALRTSRLRPGRTFGESAVERARSYLAASGYFESVGEARVERRGDGGVDVRIPVSDAKGANTFQGGIGFSKKTTGEYVMSGAAALDLRNVAGSGRAARLDWLNDGEDYSRIGLRFREPFLVRTPVALDAEVSQVVQDSVFVWSAGSLTFGVPAGPAATILVGAAVDRNVPESGDLLRSTRQRFRLGLSTASPSGRSLTFLVEGAYRSIERAGGVADRDGEIIYDIGAAGSIGTFEGQALYLHAASRGVFARGEVPLAETYPLGGATTLRGYREAQFRGEKIAWANVEYRFGEGGAFYLFDDVGAYRAPGGEWTVKNGVGFGIRAASPVGVVNLSFGVGERLSLDETRLHIALVERF